VTNQRALIFNGLLRPTIKSVMPGDISSIELEPSWNGTGNVSFAKETIAGAEGARTEVAVGFLHVRDTKAAESALVAMKSEARRAQ
jgi:hypothetical protein